MPGAQGQPRDDHGRFASGDAHRVPNNTVTRVAHTPRLLTTRNDLKNAGRREQEIALHANGRDWHYIGAQNIRDNRWTVYKTSWRMTPEEARAAGGESGTKTHGGSFRVSTHDNAVEAQDAMRRLP